jgi:hypothetical protein
MENTLIEASPYFFLAYILIKEFAPTVAKILEIVIPEKAKQKRLNQEKELELLEKRLDIEERAVVAQEQIAKALIILETDHDYFKKVGLDLDQRLDRIETDLSSMGKNISILVDRSIRLRKTDKET